jgi:hypothetical protein
MRIRASRMVAVALAVALALAAAGVDAGAGADVPPPSRVVTNYETDTGRTVYRDAGISVPIAPMPGQPAGENRAMWIFGDTFQEDEFGNPWPPPNPYFPSFVPGTFAAIGPYTPGQVPTGLSHVPSPPSALTVPNSDGPAWLVPPPTDMRLPSGALCSGPPALYQAAWPFGATRGPQGPMTLRNGTTPVSVPDGSQLVFVSMTDVCMYDSASASPCADGEVWDLYPVSWTFQRTKVVAYRPADNTIVATTPLFQTTDGSCLPWQKQIFYQPVFHGGFLYLHASNCEDYAAAVNACVSGKVTAARVPVAQMHDPNAYRWADGAGGWTASFASAGTILPATPSHLGPIMVDVHDFSSVGEGFLLMEQTSFGGHYNLYESATPAGPWTLRRSDRMAGCLVGDDEGCYNLYAHPELSTPGHLAYSYVNISEGLVTVADIGGV